MSTRYNTGNPIESTDVRDMSDNAKNFDEFSVSTQPTFSDRLGVERKTLPSLISQAEQDIYYAVINAGFQPASFDFVTGGTLVDGERNKAVLNPSPTGDNNWYAWQGAFPKIISPNSTPSTSGGLGDNAWKPVTNNILAPTVRESIRRSYAEAGYNVVGTFQAGFTIVNANDVGIDETTGMGFTGPAGTVAAGTNPASGVFVDRSGELLRTEFLRRDGDVRGWGAKLDGVTYDDAAFAAAIAATGGRITVRGHARLSTNTVFNGLAEPCVTFDVGGKISIDTDFSFHPYYRGILAFQNCHNPKVVEPVIVGARVDKLSAPEPWEDGDTGIEYIDCTGVCKTINPVLSDFKAWGVMHINVEGYLVTNPIINGCLVQSGVGGHGVQHGSVVNPDMEWIGLYGIEIESSVQNKLISVNGGRISRALQAVAIVNNSDDVIISDVLADRCRTGFAVVFASANRSFVSGTSHNCLYDIVLASATNANVNVRQTTDGATNEFIRSRSYDFFMKVVGDVGYVLDRPDQPAGIAVGRILLLESGVQKTVTEVIGTEIDPVMGQVVKIRTSPALVAEDARKMFMRDADIGVYGRYLVMYDGSNNTVKGGSIRNKAGGIESYGSHENFIWGDVTIREVDTLFIQGSYGTASGRVSINASDVISVGSVGSTSKFAPTFRETKEFQISSSALGKTQSLHVPGGVIGKISVTLNDDVTSSGTIVLKVNGVDNINFSAGAKKGSAHVHITVGADEVIKVSLADTVGDITGSGYSVTLYGAFTK